jgi:hypothetical protein
VIGVPEKTKHCSPPSPFSQRLHQPDIFDAARPAAPVALQKVDKRTFTGKNERLPRFSRKTRFSPVKAVSQAE